MASARQGAPTSADVGLVEAPRFDSGRGESAVVQERAVFRLWLVSAIGLLVLSACGSRADRIDETRGETEPAQAGSEADSLEGLVACELIAADEVEEILGEPAASEGEGAGFVGGEAACAWSTDSGTTLALTVLPDSGWDSAKGAAERGLGAAGGDGEAGIELAYEEVAGIGDDAFLQRFRAAGETLQTTLHVRAEGRHFTFTVTTDPARLLELAPLIVGRVSG